MTTNKQSRAEGPRCPACENEKTLLQVRFKGQEIWIIVYVEIVVLKKTPNIKNITFYTFYIP